MSLQPEGIWVALVTPLTPDDRVDVAALERMASWLMEEGVHGLVPLGTTGEAACLDEEERRAVLETVVGVAKGRVPVLAGAGTSCTRETIERCHQAERWGADGCLVVTPPYNKPSQAGLVAHFKQVAAETNLPIILYSVPSRAGVRLEPETVMELAALDRFAGIKDATADMGAAARMWGHCPSTFALLSGDDETALPYWAVGGRGVITVTGHVAPRMFVRMWEAYRGGDLESARKIHARLLPLYRALFAETSPSPVKAALAMMGKCSERVRLPLVPMSSEGRKLLEGVLGDLAD